MRFRPGTPRGDISLEKCEDGSLVSGGTVKNSSKGTADYQITVAFENDIGFYLARINTDVTGVRPDQQRRWTATASPRHVRGDEPYSLTVVGCSVTVIKFVDGQQDIATAAPEYVAAANRLCSDLQRQVEAAALTADGQGWARLKTHAELSRPILDQLRRLPPTEQALELLEALDDWEQFLAQEEELGAGDLSKSEKERAWDLIGQPGIDAGSGLRDYGLTACAETLPNGV